MPSGSRSKTSPSRSLSSNPEPGRNSRACVRAAPDMTEKVWFITGTSRGFGNEWATAALERGDKVASTARNGSPLETLVAKYGDAILPIELDVTDRDADFAAVKQAHEKF